MQGETLKITWCFRYGAFTYDSCPVSQERFRVYCPLCIQVI